jgi:hypothetical protein
MSVNRFGTLLDNMAEHLETKAIDITHPELLSRRFERYASG